uniref:Extracellular lipase (EC) n=1 Tax=Ganoderma boninense TaxID=34458 RepID=A0A5K1K7Q4_9APHY|nr:Extracellular lipase (EC [Ganoderma boninense]
MAPTSSSFALLVALLALAPSLHAAPPTSISGLLARQDDIIPLTREEVSAFKPYTWYAATTACNLSAIMEWNCGTNCEANPTFKPIATGGDGDYTQFWFAGYDPTLDTVIVAHQGTDVSKLLPVLIDLDILQVNLNSTLFPGVDPSVLVHEGFAGTHSRSAPGVIAAVQQALSMSQRKTITRLTFRMTLTGAAIALLDAVYLPLHLPSDVTVSYRGYASPRVGNQAFADYVDSLGMSATRVNNKEDPVPVLPPIQILGYHHVSGEIHIRDDNVWVSCPGQDNPSAQCSTGDVNFSNFNATQHPGPFDGVSMGTC